jgi:hypothetical protein
VIWVVGVGAEAWARAPTTIPRSDEHRFAVIVLVVFCLFFSFPTLAPRLARVAGFSRSDPYRTSDYDMELTVVEARDLKDVSR